MSKRNVKLILKVLSDLEPVRGSSNKKTLYSTRSRVNWTFFGTNSSNKLLFFFFFKILFAVFNISFVGHSLAKNNLNNTYQCNMISNNFSKTMNYLIILIKFKVSRCLCRQVYKGIHDRPSWL
jgi:hypothetical protein